MSDTSESSFSSGIFSRHLEELEELQSGASSFEESTNYSNENSDGEPSLEWRRQLLEESSNRFQQAIGRTLDPNKIYETGTMLFDPKEGKFGRVTSSVAGHLVVAFLHGGQREYDRDDAPGKLVPKKGSKIKSVAAKAKKSNSKANASPAKGKGKTEAAGSKTRSQKNRAPGIDDVNAYIKANYQTMSNRELAAQAGLSEHTIRRKLGEWGLKRKKK